MHFERHFEMPFKIIFFPEKNKYVCLPYLEFSDPLPSDSFTILGLWVLGLAVSHINESQLQTYESRTLF